MLRSGAQEAEGEQVSRQEPVWADVKSCPRLSLTDCFEQFRTEEVSHEAKCDFLQLTYKQVLERESPSTVKAMRSQGWIQIRSHPLLDHDAAETTELPQEERVQCRYTEEHESVTMVSKWVGQVSGA